MAGTGRKDTAAEGAVLNPREKSQHALDCAPELSYLGRHATRSRCVAGSDFTSRRNVFAFFELSASRRGGGGGLGSGERVDRPVVSGSDMMTSALAPGWAMVAGEDAARRDGSPWVITVASGGLYAASPGLLLRVGWRSSYSPNAKHPATPQ